MSSPALVSCIVPTYNGEEWIVECIESVLAQSYPAVQVIVVDDGSTDSTVRRVQEAFGPKVTMVSQRNMGVARARNVGMEKGTGEYLAFIDQDDRWIASKLAKQVEALASEPRLAAVHCDAVEFHEAGSERRRFSQLHLGLRDNDRLAEALIDGAIPLVSALMFRRECLTANGIRFSEEAPGVDDLGLLLEMKGRGLAIRYLDWIGVERRMHSRNQSSDHLRRFERRIILYNALICRCTYMDHHMRRLLCRGLDDAAYRVGEWYFGRNEMTEARRYFGMAIRSRRCHARCLLGLAGACLPVGLVTALRRVKERFASGAKDGDR